ncbi:MAG: hypothetical protein ACE5DP_03995, partial [Fidelibacterota bacterium]
MEKIIINWKVQLALGVVLMLAVPVVFYWGYQLKQTGEAYSHIWILALGFLWVGSDQIKKAVNKTGSNS